LLQRIEELIDGKTVAIVSIAQSRLPLLQPDAVGTSAIGCQCFNRSVAITVAATAAQGRLCGSGGNGFNRSVAITVAAT